jgi:hypothetical protein
MRRPWMDGVGDHLLVSSSKHRSSTRDGSPTRTRHVLPAGPSSFRQPCPLLARAMWARLDRGGLPGPCPLYPLQQPFFAPPACSARVRGSALQPGTVTDWWARVQAVGLKRSREGIGWANGGDGVKGQLVKAPTATDQSQRPTGGQCPDKLPPFCCRALLVNLLVRLLLPIPRHLHRSLLCQRPSLCTPAVVACPVPPSPHCAYCLSRCAPSLRTCLLPAFDRPSPRRSPPRFSPAVSSAIAASSHRDSLTAPSADPT